MKIFASALALVVILAITTGSNAYIQGCIEYGPKATNGTESCNTCSTLTFKNNATFSTACLDCQKPCMSCSSLTTCLTCQAGFYLSGMSCVSCGANCNNCYNGACSSCAVGYGLNDGVCTKCSDNCLECTSSTYCTRCMSNFDYVNTNNGVRNCAEISSSSNIWWWVLGVTGGLCLLGAIAACFLYGKSASSGPEYATSYVPPAYQTTGYTQLVETKQPVAYTNKPIYTPQPQVLTQTTKTAVVTQPVYTTAPTQTDLAQPAPVFQQITPGYTTQTQYIQTQPGAGSYYVQGAQPRVASTVTTPTPYQPQMIVTPGQQTSTVVTGPVTTTNYQTSQFR